MRQFGSGSIIALLCIAIAFVCFTSPSRENVSAQQVEQAKSGLAEVEQLKDGFVQFLEMQSDMNAKLTEVDKATVEKLGELFKAVDDTREVVKLTAFTVAENQDGCTCGEKLAELQAQIDELKSKVATLETKCASPVAASSYSAPQAVTGSSGGSTGTVKSGGSTGSVASGGSTGSVKTSGGSTGNVTSGGSTGMVKLGGSTGSVRASVATAAGDPHIVVVTTPSCTRCPAVIDQVHHEYSPAGWTVDVESEDVKQNTSYPYFRVCVGSQCEEIHCDVSQLNTLVKLTLTKWGVSFGESAGSTGSSGTTSDKQTRAPLRTAFQLVNSPVRAAGNVLASWGTGRALEVAQASAQYRAANRIKGHSPVDLRSGMANGVGWSTSNSQPQTCFWNRRSQGAYASVQGVDGYYGTLVLY